MDGDGRSSSAKWISTRRFDAYDAKPPCRRRRAASRPSHAIQSRPVDAARHESVSDGRGAPK